MVTVVIREWHRSLYKERRRESRFGPCIYVEGPGRLLRHGTLKVFAMNNIGCRSGSQHRGNYTLRDKLVMPLNQKDKDPLWSEV